METTMMTGTAEILAPPSCGEDLRPLPTHKSYNTFPSAARVHQRSYPAVQSCKVDEYRYFSFREDAATVTEGEKFSDQSAIRRTVLQIVGGFLLVLALLALPQLLQSNYQDQSTTLQILESELASEDEAKSRQEFEELLTLPVVNYNGPRASDARGLHLSLSYPGVGKVGNHDLVPMHKAKSAPRINLSGTLSAPLTVIMLDVDAPDPKDPSHSPFVHYIISNYIPGQDFDTTLDYYPVSPPTGVHRYLTFVLEQSSPMTESATPRDRQKFNLTAYAILHDLILLPEYLLFVSKPEKKMRG